MKDLATRFALHPASGAEAPDGLAVTGVSVDSADVARGEIFVALPGFTHHGAQFAPEAVAAGAVAVLNDEAGAAAVRASLPQVPVLIAQ